MNIHEPINATDDGMNPDSIATEGSAKMPAPTVVPATKDIALNNSLSIFDEICSVLLACVIFALPRPFATDAELPVRDLVTRP